MVMLLGCYVPAENKRKCDATTENGSYFLE